jgi:hypothetical protein
MKPWLLATLVATLLASGGLALWPADTPDDLLPGNRPTRTTPQPPRAAVHAVPAAPRGQAAPAEPSTPAQLPTRPADWPAPPAAALAAWQGLPAPAPALAVRPALAASAGAVPVFPYRWIGQLDDGGAPQVLLASAQRSVAVRLGATLDNRWRLLTGPGGVLQVQPLPDGTPLAVPGAPPAAQP